MAAQEAPDNEVSYDTAFVKLARIREVTNAAERAGRYPWTDPEVINAVMSGSHMPTTLQSTIDEIVGWNNILLTHQEMMVNLPFRIIDVNEVAAAFFEVDPEYEQFQKELKKLERMFNSLPACIEIVELRIKVLTCQLHRMFDEQ